LASDRRGAGLDTTTKEPLELTVKKMSRVMEEMETLLDKKGNLIEN